MPHTEAEVRVMADHEWIVEPEDFLRRRTMLAQVQRVETWPRIQPSPEPWNSWT
ncbi:MAG: hypothetical protein Ct9H300mP12_17370 [Acidimicrobiales bacterium]|nr:MAG: hypothetical protein Ct9H300mP12_17370 [Acidimicrobiales bacterium]